MERVAFLHEETNARVGCLLNPESLVLRRHAGVAPRPTAGGLVTGTDLSDDPLMFTGGGVTELELDLLFDVALANPAGSASDVRELTGPLWELAENQRQQNSYGIPPSVRFFWGKWNMPGIVIAVAERLEYFTSAGLPQRSWLRMRLRRISEPVSGRAAPRRDLLEGGPREPVPARVVGPGVTPEIHEVTGGGQSDDGSEPVADERLDQIAHRYYGQASLWRLIASFNDIVDPLRVASGQLLELPPLSELDESP